MSDTSKYDNVYVSDKTENGMTLTIDDRKFIKSCLDFQDEYTEEYVVKALDLRDKELFKAIREFIIEENKKIHIRLDALDTRIERIEGKLNEYDKRISKLEETEKNVLFLEKDLIKINNLM